MERPLPKWFWTSNMTTEQWTVKDLRQLKLHKETPFRVGQQPLDMGYTFYFFNLVRSVRGQGGISPLSRRRRTLQDFLRSIPGPARAALEFLRGLKLKWAYQQELKACLELIETLKQKEKEQNRLVEKLCKESPQARLLTTLPGIGYHSGLLIANEMGEPERFPNGERFASYSYQEYFLTAACIDAKPPADSEA